MKNRHSDTSMEAPPQAMGLLVGVLTLIDEYIKEQVAQAVAEAHPPAKRGRRPRIRTKEACEQLAISPGKLYKLVNAGKITRYKVGRCACYDPDELERFNESEAS